MRKRYAVLLAVVVLGGLTLGTAAASSHLGTDISADPATGNVSADHTVTVEVGEVANGSSLSGVEIIFNKSFVDAGGSVAGPASSSDKVLRFGVDTDGDGTIEKGASGSVSTTGSAQRLLVQNSSGPGITAGSHVVVEYTGAMNPANGTYDLNVTLNPQSAGQTTNTTLTLGESTEQNPTVPGASGPAQDTDGDGMLEDVNGDGDTNVFDALTYYNNRDSDVITNNPDLFNFDGEGATGTVFDAIALYNDITN